MTTTLVTPWVRRVPLIIAGPMLIGAALGLQAGPAELLSRAVTLPAIIVGVTLLMLPALYIGAAFLGVAPKARAMARSGSAALADTGIIMLGLAPSLLFLIAASTKGTTVVTLGTLVLGVSVLLGLRALFLRLFDRRSLLALALFLGWSLVSVGIGGQLVARAMLVT